MLMNFLKNGLCHRQEQPGKFCAITSTFFFLLAMVGSRITTLGLLYYISVGYLTLPGVMKLLVKYPAVQCEYLTKAQCYKKVRGHFVIDRIVPF